MLTEDYIMRMISVAVAALVRLVGLRAAGKHQEAIQLIDQSLEGLVGLRADLIRRLDDQALLASLTIQDVLDVDRVLVIADLYFEEGEILTAQSQPERAYWSYLRALNFYLEAVLNSPGQVDTPRLEKIDAALQRLSGQALPQEVLFSLFSYYESTGNFGRAASALEEMVEASGAQAEMLVLKADFYTRLLELNDTILEQSGLPRVQVLAALERMQRNA